MNDKINVKKLLNAAREACKSFEGKVATADCKAAMCARLEDSMKKLLEPQMRSKFRTEAIEGSTGAIRVIAENLPTALLVLGVIPPAFTPEYGEYVLDTGEKVTCLEGERPTIQPATPARWITWEIELPAKGK